MTNVRINPPQEKVTFFVGEIMVSHMTKRCPFTTPENTKELFSNLRKSWLCVHTRPRLVFIETSAAEILPTYLALTIGSTRNS
jgi:hypothetical protein